MARTAAGRHTTDLMIFRRVLRQAQPYAWRITGILVLSLLSTPLALLTPLPRKIVVDNVRGDAAVAGLLAVILPSQLEGLSTSLLWIAVVLLLLIALMNRLQGLALELASTAAGERPVLDFRSHLFRHAQRLSLGYHDMKGTSDSVYRIQYDAPALQHLTIGATLPLVTSALTLVAMVVVITRIDPDLAVVALLVSPILFGLSKMYQRPLRKRYNLSNQG